MIQVLQNQLIRKMEVININHKENHEILKKCSVLREYSEFVEIVRKHKEAGEQEYFRKAIDECIKRGILKEYLERKGSEVLNMLIAEYDYDLDIEVQREEAYEDGMKEKLVELIRKKVKKGKNILEIAQELEETPEEVEKLINEYGLDYYSK